MSLTGYIHGFTGEYRFLSNFWPVKVMLDEIEYASTEHAYQAAKTIDIQERKIFLNCTAGAAKRKGKTVTKRNDWNEIKLFIMLDLNRQKFKDNKLRELLLKTDEAYIEETNHWGDTFWGVCDGKGRNELGIILMLIRQEIQKEIRNSGS